MAAANPAYAQAAPAATVLVAASVVVTMLTVPLITRAGLATADEVDVDTLAARLRAGVVAGGGVAASPVLVGAFARA